MKKICIVGRGTVGCLAVAHFLRWTNWEIEWIYDPNISPTPVGEGTNLALPISLYENLNFDSSSFDKIHSTPKLGIWKRNWGEGEEFFHCFPAGNHGVHFNAIEFQDYVFKLLENNSRVTCKETNYSDPNNIDSDIIMVCTGSPAKLTDDFDYKNYIPVNSAMVFQCPWDLPKFLYSLTFAKKYGWVFGIPLKNRCAIGYVFNSDFCTEDDIKEDVQSILDEFDLKPKLVRSLKFYNYSRKINFKDNIIYNGNASFFLEPLEATSTSTSDIINRITIDLFFMKKIDISFANQYYSNYIENIGSMISLHYLSGSVYKNDFWEYAKGLAKNKIECDFKKNNLFSEMMKLCISNDFNYDLNNETSEIGTWTFRSFKQHLDTFKLNETMKNLILKYK